MGVPTGIAFKDADQKTRSFEGLSQQYAAGEHTWLALHAQVASDLAAADRAANETRSTTWSRAAAADAIAALDLGDSEPRQIAFLVREAISNQLDDIAFQSWREVVGSLDHLDGLPSPDVRIFGEALSQRFAGRTTEEYLWQRQTEAVDCSRKAQDARQTGAPKGAVIMAQYDGDVAAFEAWLIRRSLELRDFHLTQYELMWALGTAALSALPQLPAEPETARHMVLSRMAWAVGPQEAAQFISYALNPEE